LEREVAAFQPAIVFAFSDGVYTLIRKSSVGNRINLQPALYHPAGRRSRQDIQDANDAQIEKVLAEAVR
jgi:hypothetical protein